MDPRRAPADSSLDAGWITALHTPSALEMADTAPCAPARCVRRADGAAPNGSRAESDTPVTDDEALGVTRLPREVVASIINFASARSDTLPSSFGSLLELETLHLRDMRRWTLRTSNANAAATYSALARVCPLADARSARVASLASLRRARPLQRHQFHPRREPQ